MAGTGKGGQEGSFKHPATGTGGNPLHCQHISQGLPVGEDGVERRLTTILTAEVVGQSRLMREDEAGTLTHLKSLRKDPVQPKIAEGRGRIVKLMGDGLLAEFPSVVEAVQCTVDIQQDMATREADLPNEQRIRIRIGVNLGDVIVEGSDLYGDGVNIATRLEAIGRPGHVVISDDAMRQVAGRRQKANRRVGVAAARGGAESSAGPRRAAVLAAVIIALREAQG